MDALSNEVYKHHRDVVYTVMGFMPGPADQAAATAAYMAAMDKWGKTFLKDGKFVLGDKLSIADFKVETLTLRLYSHTPCDYLCS